MNEKATSNQNTFKNFLHKINIWCWCFREIYINSSPYICFLFHDSISLCIFILPTVHSFRSVESSRPESMASTFSADTIVGQSLHVSRLPVSSRGRSSLMSSDLDFGKSNNYVFAILWIFFQMNHLLLFVSSSSSLPFNYFGIKSIIQSLSA